MDFCRALRYRQSMAKAPETSFLPDVAEQRKRRLEFMRLQEIEGNPLAPDEVAMFEMFERDNWSPERRRRHITALALGDLAAE